MEPRHRLIDYYLPPGEGFVLESVVATTYQVDFEFVEEELLAAALGVRSPAHRLRAFRSELESRLQKTEVSVLYDLSGCDRLARLSPRIDAIPIARPKLHSKISLLMWVRESTVSETPPDRRIRLIVGSANLTRQGFRHNYECVVSLDFGGTNKSPRSLLLTAIGLVQQIGNESQSPQLARQLAEFSRQASILPEGVTEPETPVALVSATEVVPAISDLWAAVSTAHPETVTVVSPFWPEGSTAALALTDLFQKLGPPAHLELVCVGEKSADGRSWLPVFDGNVAMELKKRLDSRIYLRPALPETAHQQSPQSVEETGDETEEQEFATRVGGSHVKESESQRMLHAKLILVDGTAGSVLYIGSSNCTRLGLGLGGTSVNSEAGFVYRLTPRQRKKLKGLFEFAGPPTEVNADHVPPTIPPKIEDDAFSPAFLAEVVASGSVVTIRFRDTVPSDLVVLMPIPAKAVDPGYWLLYRREADVSIPDELVTIDLTSCPRCDEHLVHLPDEVSGQHVQPHVYVEVRSQGCRVNFPVRFDDKTQLPLLLAGRKPTESEILEHYLSGKPPGDTDDGSGALHDSDDDKKTDAPVDTRRILAYFIRQFVQAIPGIEAELSRANYSRPSLDAALRGPTSPLALAERVFASLTMPETNNEPKKTPTAVGFQLTEILASLLRCRSGIADPALQDCFEPVIDRCRKMLSALVAQEVELQTEEFRRYQFRILGDA